MNFRKVCHLKKEAQEAVYLHGILRFFDYYSDGY